MASYSLSDISTKTPILTLIEHTKKSPRHDRRLWVKSNCNQTTPNAIIESATLRKPAMFAPAA